MACAHGNEEDSTQAQGHWSTTGPGETALQGDLMASTGLKLHRQSRAVITLLTDRVVFCAHPQRRLCVRQSWIGPANIRSADQQRSHVQQPVTKLTCKPHGGLSPCDAPCKRLAGLILVLLAGIHPAGRGGACTMLVDISRLVSCQGLRGLDACRHTGAACWHQCCGGVPGRTHRAYRSSFSISNLGASPST